MIRGDLALQQTLLTACCRTVPADLKVAELNHRRATTVSRRA
jgi:hypothetical protein